MAGRENFSRKREAIYSAVMGTTVHPTAEWVFETLKPEYPDLSLGTVYRNLKKFCETGRIRSVGVINGQEHFDGDTTQHSHFVCDTCGQVLDIFEPMLGESAVQELEEKYALEIERESVLFGGTCAECKQKTKAG